jgi:hypothetical protein
MDGARAHALLTLLAADDIDAAMENNLLGTTNCPGCLPSCMSRLAQARHACITCRDARDRYRIRTARLLRRKAERDAARITVAPQMKAPTLPASAADALARALAKARTPR